MELTGNCKEDFKDWYFDNLIEYEGLIPAFKVLPPSMQWGVYVDFFDSKKLYIETQAYTHLNPVLYGSFVNDFPSKIGDSKNLSQARTTAIEKANKLYNQDPMNEKLPLKPRNPAQ